MQTISPITLFQIFAFLLGAVVGSFLNVVIYRLPLGLSVNEPKRSFCPHCKTQIPWYENIPLFSWLALRGKCARCGAPISFRYFGVELLTALLFLGIWILCANAGTWSLVLPLWTLTGLLIAATFIDFDHFIIPDEITLGGTVAGLVLSAIFPAMMSETSHLRSLFWSVVGAAAGYLLLWGVVEAGKLAFGKKKHVFNPPAEFRWTRDGEDAEFVVGDDKMLWSDIFSRETDQMIMETESPLLDGQPIPEAAESETATLRFFYNRVILPGAEAREVVLDTVAMLAGKVRLITIPREAMGFGDVKLIACIGAFLGWKAVLFTVAAGSCIGALVGIALLLTGRRNASGRIPFGPYLALGALLWIACGPYLIEWYLGLLLLGRLPVSP